VQGNGVMLSNAAAVEDGHSSPTMFEFGFGKVVVNCNISGGPTVSFTSQQTASVYQLMVTTITSGGTADVETSNGLTAGATYTQPNSSGLPQQVTLQVHYVDSSNVAHLATAWVTDQKDAPAASCDFFGQAMTTG
jgi:ABC-type phosphate transport system substrate-binding protein